MQIRTRLWPPPYWIPACAGMTGKRVWIRSLASRLRFSTIEHMRRLKRLRAGLLPHRLAVVQTMLLLVFSFAILTSQAAAVIRFQNRSLFIYDPTPSVTTKYTISFTYNNQGVFTTTVGSIDLLFCIDPIPSDAITLQNPVDSHPCVTPPGLDVSNAVLSDQTGETGFSILSQSTDEIVLTRAPTPAAETPSTYTFDNVVNPVDTSHSFAIRMADYPTTDASGPLINLGSVLSETSVGIGIETQVPPILVFCVAQQVAPDCSDSSGGNETDLGTLDPNSTLTATSQMAAGTNASGGYAIVAYGTSMEAGTNVIDPLTSPTASAPGNSQFGINLVQNASPAIGADPDGPSINAVVAANYANPDEFMFQDGDLVASAPNVSLVRRFTVSYIVNVPPDLRPGVYTTSITYLCTGQF